MKKIIMSVLIIFTFSAIHAQKTDVEVPSQISSYINKHFPGKTVIRYKKEVERKGTEHKIYLSDYVKMEFNTQFIPVEIKGEGKLPESVLPSAIVAYVKANYPDLFIVEWEKKRNKQEVELNNDLELEFDLNGKFLRIDH